MLKRNSNAKIPLPHREHGVGPRPHLPCFGPEAYLALGLLNEPHIFSCQLTLTNAKEKKKIKKKIHQRLTITPKISTKIQSLHCIRRSRYLTTFGCSCYRPCDEGHQYKFCCQVQKISGRCTDQACDLSMDVQGTLRSVPRVNFSRGNKECHRSQHTTTFQPMYR